MNFSSAIGLVGGFALVAVAAVFSLQDPSVLWNPLGLVIVLGGTLAAGLVSFSGKEMLRVVRVFFIVLRNEKLYVEQDVAELAKVSKFAAKASIPQLERSLKAIKNPFLRRGIELVIDGSPIDEISGILTWRIEKLKAREAAEADVFRTLAAFAPAFGMAGTLFGLMNLLSNLGEDLGQIGAGLAVALMATLYGIMAANLLLRPLAVKLEHRTELRVEIMNTVLEGVLMIAQKYSATRMKAAMGHLTAEHDDELRGSGAERRRPAAAG